MHTRCLDWCLPSVTHSPSSSSQTFGSSPSKRTGNGVIVCKYVHGELVGFRRQKPYRIGSLEHSRARGGRFRSSCSTSSDFFLDDENSREIQDFTAKLEFSDKFSSKSNGVGGRKEICSSDMKFIGNSKPFECFEPPDWLERDESHEINLACAEQRKFNSPEIPILLRMIQRKNQWKEEGEGVIKEIKESACTSLNKAFSSMVLIIQELHSYTLQMRELLFYEDLQGILSMAQNEIQASFVWLFQQVFSQTPTLMVSLMLLLANYSVHSMANNAAIAYTMLPQAYTATATSESVSVVLDDQVQSHVKTPKFDSSEITTSIGGGGGKIRPVASSTDGEGRYDRVSSYSIIQNPSIKTNEEEESGVLRELTKQDMRLWKLIKEKATKMQAEALDRETTKKLISPVHATIEADDYKYYSRTETLYLMALCQDPNNSLLLTNYAQFLYLVIHDHDRAEQYFERAIKAKPKDGEAFEKYANFLWLVKNDTWGAEQAYLEAMDTDPSNSHYLANYAYFLWHTGGEGTCLAT